MTNSEFGSRGFGYGYTSPRSLRGIEQRLDGAIEDMELNGMHKAPGYQKLKDVHRDLASAISTGAFEDWPRTIVVASPAAQKPKRWFFTAHWDGNYFVTETPMLPDSGVTLDRVKHALQSQGLQGADLDADMKAITSRNLAGLVEGGPAQVGAEIGMTPDPLPGLRDLVARWRKIADQMGNRPVEMTANTHRLFANELEAELDAITGDDVRDAVMARMQETLAMSAESDQVYAQEMAERAEKAEGLYKIVAAMIAEYEDISLQGGLAAAIKRLREKQIAGERDTVRLNWLQEMEGRGLGVVFGTDLPDVVKHGTLREAIDAAMPIPYTVTEAGKAAVHCDRCDYECVCTNNKRLFPGVG